jgi:aldehyde dehydrogenase (NAD+)
MGSTLDDSIHTASGMAAVRGDVSGASQGSGISYEALVADVRQTFNSGKSKDIEWRRTQLKAISTAFKENHLEITKAIRADLGGPKMRGIGDLGPAMAAEDALHHLDAWTAPQKVGTPMHMNPVMMVSSYVRQEAKGVVLVIGPWNFPIELLFHPVVAAIAAGNCVVLKPSEMAPNCAALIEHLVKTYLDTSCIKVVQGGVPETSALLKCHWDHIMYTGNGAVGRIVAKAAAEHLTPCTLELGGKSPVYIDKSANMQSAVERISTFKWFLNAGQICVAPDYVMVHKDREEEFVTKMRERVDFLFGKDPKQSPTFGRIINSSHVRRIGSLLDKTEGQVVAGGMETVDAEAKYVPPTIVRNAKMGEPLMDEEIFGPVLPIMKVDSAEEAVANFNKICSSPLALYVYAEDKKAIDTVLDNTQSGGVCINSSGEQLLNNELPFGGIGGSGYGAYHGKAGFDEFTHRRSVLHQDTKILKGASMPPHPTDEVYDMAVKFMITGFLTESQKKNLKTGLAVAGTAVAGALLRSRL